MPPSPPAILGPVSECSRTVRVMGQSSGSRVRIYVDADPVPLADQQVGWADATVAVDASRLSPGRHLRATQEVGGQESARSLVHLAQVFRLADAAGLLRDPERAAARMRQFLAVHGVE